MTKKFGEGKVSYKSSGKGKYKAVWIYIPKVIADDNEFPFKNKERVHIEIENGKLLVSKKNELFNIINSLGLENATIPKILENKAIENKNKPFLYYKDKIYSYKDINNISNQVAHGLQNILKELKTKKTIVGLALRNSPEFFFSWFGISKLGCISVMVNPFIEEPMLEHTLMDSKAKLLIIDYEFYKKNKDVIEKASKLKRIIIKDAPKSFKFTEKYVNYKDIISEDTSNPEIKINSWNKMEIIYSAGATRMPKGILYRQFITITGLIIAKEMEGIVFNKDEIVYCPLPLYNGFTRVSVVLPILFSDGSIALSEEFNASTFWDEVNTYKATGTVYFGWLLSYLLKQPPSKTDREHSLKWAYGSVATREIWESFEYRFGIPIYECYTLAEGSITINKAGSRKGKLGSIGKAITGFEVKIIDENGREKPPGRENVGEIVSKIALPVILDDSQEEKWNHSGDLGYKDEDGFIYFVGREKDTIEKTGRIANVRSIEKIANLHPFVLESAAFTVPNDQDEDQKDIKVCIVLKKPDSISHKDIHQYLSENLAYFMIPRYIEFVDQIYRSPVERVRTFTLKEDWHKSEVRKRTWDSNTGKFVE